MRHAAETGRIYISTTQQLLCLDLVTEKLLWEKRYEGGCDRMSITPDGKTIYLPSLEGPTGTWSTPPTAKSSRRSSPTPASHNTVVALDGRLAFLAGLRSPLLTVVDTSTNEVVKTVGPFAAADSPVYGQRLIDRDVREHQRALGL